MPALLPHTHALPPPTSTLSPPTRPPSPTTLPLCPRLLQVLFPESYTGTSQWMAQWLGPGEEQLFACQQQLLAALDQHPGFKELTAGCTVRRGQGSGTGARGGVCVWWWWWGDVVIHIRHQAPGTRHV